MEPTIIRFLGFVGLELLYVIVTFIAVVIPLGIAIQSSRKLKNIYAVVIAFLAILVTFGFMFLFLLVLTGENFFWTILVLTITSVILMAVVELFWLIFGGSNVPWFGRVVWMGYEQKQSIPKLEVSTNVLGLIILIIYPIHIGLGYFGDVFVTEDWPRYVMRSTLVVLFGFGMLIQLPSMLHIMTSKNVMEGTRSRVVFSQLGGAVTALLLVSLFVWTTRGAEKSVEILGEHFVFTPVVGYVTVAYILIIVIIPYLVGHYRSKHWIVHLEGIRDGFIDKLSKILLGTSPGSTLSELQELKTDIETALDEMGADSSVQLADTIANSSDESDLVYRLALESSEDRDPRLLCIKSLKGLIDLIEKCEFELQKKTEDSEIREILKSFRKLLESDTSENKDTNSKSKPWVLIGIASLVLSFLNPIISSIAKLVSAQLGFPSE